MAAGRTPVIDLMLRVLVVVGLAIDAVVHLQLARGYQLAAPGGIGEGNLFRIEAGAAIAAGLYVLLRNSRNAYVLAALVTLGGLAAVLLYRYVDVPAIGPVPSMHEPIWFFKKTLSAVAQAVAGLAAVTLAVRARRRHARRSAWATGRR